MAIRFVRPAEEELDDAIRYYEDQLTGLGRHFFSQVQQTLELVARTPYAWRLISERTRRINIKGFPYLLLYVIDGDDIIVTCMAHQHRNPQFYLGRGE